LLSGLLQQAGGLTDKYQLTIDDFANNAIRGIY
jgi:hypothetical protein